MLLAGRAEALALLERALELNPARDKLASLLGRWTRSAEAEEGYFTETRTHIEVAYDLNLGELFYCASGLGLFLEPMPAEPVPVRGIHWVDEGQGESGVLWMSLHSVNVHP